MSVLVTAFLLWTSSSDSSGFYSAVFGYAFGNAIVFLAVIYVLAFLLDIVAAIVLRGWRNRVMALAGVIVLVVPVIVGIWIAESP